MLCLVRVLTGLLLVFIAQTVTAYGTIFGGQATTATFGNYTDTVNITVTFSP